jgi:hypothetical protein
VRPRLALLLGALVIPALPLVAAGPAHAAGTICVNMGTACPASATTAPSVSAAIAAASPGPTLIQVGPNGASSYSDGPYTLGPGITLQGSGAGVGQGATALTLPANAEPQTYVTVNGGTLRNLRVSMTGADTTGDIGVAASGSAILQSVIIVGAGGLTGATGLQTQGSTINGTTVNVTAGPQNTAVHGLGGNTFTDNTWNGGRVGLLHTGATNDTVTRSTIQLAETAASVEAGTLTIDNSVIDLGSAGQTGLRAGTDSSAGATTIDAKQLTVVGGAVGSRGVWAYAAAPTASSSVTLANSIVRGPTDSDSLVASASNSGAATLAVHHSDYQTVDEAGGAVNEGVGNIDVDPGFLNAPAGDYSLRSGAPVVDKGDSSVVTTKDRAGNDRAFDGDSNGSPVPDLGAYELVDVTAPKTVITGGPSGPTSDNTPVFTFRSGSEVTFHCQIDGSAFQACSSPVTTTPLADGAHSFVVRATDPVFNVETSPPTRSFTVDTVTPDTRFTKKAPKRFFKEKVKFKFASSEAGAHFQCQLDGRPWRSCGSTFKYGVKRGKHTILVRAIDRAGNTDKTPARYKFKRLKRHR